MVDLNRLCPSVCHLDSYLARVAEMSWRHRCARALCICFCRILSVKRFHRSEVFPKRMHIVFVLSRFERSTIFVQTNSVTTPERIYRRGSEGLAGFVYYSPVHFPLTK